MNSNEEKIVELGRKARVAAKVVPVVGLPFVYAVWRVTHDLLATGIAVMGFVSLTACLGFFGWAALESEGED